MVVAGSDGGDGGGAHLYIAVVSTLVVVVAQILHASYEVKGFCADAYRLTTKAISQDFCTFTGLTGRTRFNKVWYKKSDTPLSFYETRQGIY